MATLRSGTKCLDATKIPKAASRKATNKKRKEHPPTSRKEGLRRTGSAFLRQIVQPSEDKHSASFIVRRKASASGERYRSRSGPPGLEVGGPASRLKGKPCSLDRKS